MDDRSATPRHLAIVWHSRTGAAAAMAMAAHDGAVAALAQAGVAPEPAASGRAPPPPVRLLAAPAATAADMLAASAYLFVCPENLGAVSGAMKEFLDTCYYPLLGPIAGRAYATAIAAGSDGSGAQRQIDRIATGWRLRRVADPLVIGTDAQSPEAIAAPKRLTAAAIADCRALGGLLAAGLALGLF